MECAQVHLVGFGFVDMFWTKKVYPCQSTENGETRREEEVREKVAAFEAWSSAGLMIPVKDQDERLSL